MAADSSSTDEKIPKKEEPIKTEMSNSGAICWGGDVSESLSDCKGRRGKTSEICGATESEVDGGRRLQELTEILTLEATFTNRGTEAANFNVMMGVVGF